MMEEQKKYCVVCGDKALGYNFNAITCESCKAFFRRNALKEKPLRCHGPGRCEITVKTRRYCQKCRLEKCLQMGMLSDLITVRPDDADQGSHSIRLPINSGKRPSPDPTPPDPPPNKIHCHSTQPQFISSPPEFPSIMKCPPASDPQSGHISWNTIHLDKLTSISQCEVELDKLQKQLEKYNGPGDPLVTLPKSTLIQMIDFCNGNGPPPAMGHVTGRTVSNVRLTGSTCLCQCKCGCKVNRGQSKSIDQDNTSQPSTSGVQREWEDWTEETWNITGPGPYSNEKVSKITGPTHCSTEEMSEIIPYSTDQKLEITRPALDITQMAGQDNLDLIPLPDPVVHFPPDMDALKLFRLEELLSANEILAPPRRQEGPPAAYADAGLAADMMDLAVRRTMRMMKRVAAFSSLELIDQIVLYKGAIQELMSLRGMMVYEASVNSFRPVGYQHRLLRLDALRPKPDGHPALRRFFNYFQETWRKCDPVMLCLSSLVLFDWTRPGLTDVTTVRSHHEYYRELLRCYLRTVYSPMEADKVFKKLFNLLRIMRENLNQLCPPIQVEIDRTRMEVMLMDIVPF